MQAKGLKWTSPKTFGKFQAPTVALKVVLRTKKVSFIGHFRSNTTEFLLNNINRYNLIFTDWTDFTKFIAPNDDKTRIKNK